jgi:hypothetical protein
MEKETEKEWEHTLHDHNNFADIQQLIERNINNVSEFLRTIGAQTNAYLV